MVSRYTSTSMEMTSPSTHCTSVRGTICPHQNVDIALTSYQNVVATTPAATAPTSSRNGDVVATAPNLYRNVAANVSTPELVNTIDKKPSHNPNLLSSKVRFTHVVMEIAIWMKSEVPFAVKCFDAIHYKLLRINVNNIDKLMKEIRNERLNTSPQNINELGFNQ